MSKTIWMICEVLSPILQQMMTFGGQLIFFYNGTNITDNLIQNTNFTYSDVLVLKNNSNSYIVSFSNGIGAVFSISSGLPNFVLNMPSSFRAGTAGLLGNFNGNQTDDLMFPNKTVLTGSSVTDRMIHAFGQSCKSPMNTVCYRGLK